MKKPNRIKIVKSEPVYGQDPIIELIGQEFTVETLDKNDNSVQLSLTVPNTEVIS